MVLLSARNILEEDNMRTTYLEPFRVTFGILGLIASESQAYVGLSRAMTLEQVFLTQLDFKYDRG
jgi:uncharacterized membrane protein